MKTRISTCLFIITIIFSATFLSCKKYPEGPSLSLRTKTERLSNSWKIQMYKFNGADSTESAKNYFYKDYKLFINKNGDYSFSYTYTRRGFILPINEIGNWVFSTDKKNVIFTKEGGNTSLAEGENYSWEILRLKEKEFWAKYIQNNDVIEMHLN